MTTLDQNKLEWVIEHLSKFSDSNIYPKIFEYDAIKYCKTEVLRKFSSFNILEWKTKDQRKCIVPKGRYGFRNIAQLDPLDMVVYLTLITEIGPDIEKNRIPVSENVVFSNRFQPDATNFQYFNPNVGFLNFQEFSKNKAEDFNYIVVTDIADFYPRIYLHRIENSLSLLESNYPNEVKAIINIIKGLNQHVSYGLPIGNNASRLLSEFVINDVDKYLISEGITFCRYVDDYRIFSNEKSEAYECLLKLANVLYDNHGLTLSQSKTKILESNDFLETVINTEERIEIRSLSEHFNELLSEIGISDPYWELSLDDLEDEEIEKIRKLNLSRIVFEELSNDDYDIPIVKFLINRLGWTQNIAPLDLFFEKINSLVPVFPELIRYLSRVGNNLDSKVRQEYSARLLEGIPDSIICKLDFNKMLVMSLFSGSNMWGNEDKLGHFFGQGSNDHFDRNVILAMGRNNQDYWLRSKKPHITSMSSWSKRALIYACSCLSLREKNAWFNALIRNRDVNILEKIVVDYAKDNPIC